MERRTAIGLVAVLLPPLLYSFYRFSIGALVPAFESTYSISDATAGGVISASVGLVAVGVFGGGLLAQRLGDARTILLGLVIFSIAEAAVVAARSLWEFSAFFFLASFGTGLVITPSYGVIASLLPGRRGFAVSLISAAYSSGGFVGPSLAGYLLVYRGWNAPFVALALIGAAFTAVFAAVFWRSGKGGPARASVSFAQVLAIRAVLVLAVADFFADLGFLVFVSWTPKYLISAFSISGGGTATIDTVFGVGVGLGGLGALTAGVLFDRLGGRKSALLSASLSALVFAALYLATPLPLALVVVLVTGFLSNSFWPLLTAMAQVSVPEGQVTSATSVVQTAGFIGAFLGPGLAGLIGGAVSSALILATVVPYTVFLAVVVTGYRDPATPARRVVAT
ncbi:MAG TPA: MFS transporter [Nitrososphaerales archaeon]|nr:MFS transporter [Nitrososphaerales archaeon]